MNFRKGLIGLFATTFLLSAISMVLLVVDDRNDLSSRAGSWLSNDLREALPGIKMIPNETSWDGTPYKLPITVKYNGAMWMPPQDRNTVFYHRELPITVRITSGEVKLPDLEKFLGKNFTAPTISNKNETLSGWSVQNYIFDFLGEKKTVSIWSGKENISLISVKPSDVSDLDIEDFAREVISTALVGQVKGLTSQEDSVRLAALIRPSVVMIMNNFCSAVKFTMTPDFILSGREYPFCVASAGSGFFINKNGYIATNGHVVKNTPSPSLFYAVVSGGLDSLLTDYLQVYTAQKTGTLPGRDETALKIKEAHASKENIYQLAALVDDLYKRNYLTLNNSNNKYYAQLGDTPLQLTKNGISTGKDIVEATVVDSDYNEPNKVTGFSSSDVAILKIEGDNYPGLPLGSIEDLEVGSTIQVIGYPGIVMGSNSFLLDTSANAEPTFTKGVVSAFKLAKGDKKRLIQTDASINHGNSGGPAVSSEGKVIGIATYGLTPEEGSGNYNFLRDIQDLKSLMLKNNIQEDSGDTYKVWKSGLENFWLSYFQYARKDFEKVSSLYPIHPSVTKYLTITKTKVNTPEDQTPHFTHSQRSLYMSLSGGTMALSLTSISILWFVGWTNNRKRDLEKPINLV